MSTNSRISTKQTTTSHFKSLNTKKTTTYVNGNLSPSLGQALTYVGFERIMESQHSLDLKRQCINKQLKYSEDLLHTQTITRGVYHISKKNRQHNGQKKKYKMTNNDLQNLHIKLKIDK